MTKADEIVLLDKTIKAFGPDSYIGPWLKESRLQIIRSIEQDYSPKMLTNLPDEARKIGANIIEQAKADAERIRKDAERDIREYRAAIDREITATRGRLSMDLSKALRAVAGDG